MEVNNIYIYTPIHICICIYIISYMHLILSSSTYNFLTSVTKFKARLIEMSVEEFQFNTKNLINLIVFRVCIKNIIYSNSL